MGIVEELMEIWLNEVCNSIQELNKDFIEFSLSTWTRSMVKSSQAKLLQ